MSLYEIETVTGEALLSMYRKFQGVVTGILLYFGGFFPTEILALKA